MTFLCRRSRLECDRCALSDAAPLLAPPPVGTRRGLMKMLIELVTACDPKRHYR